MAKSPTVALAETRTQPLCNKALLRMSVGDMQTPHLLYVCKDINIEILLALLLMLVPSDPAHNANCCTKMSIFEMFTKQS